MFECVGRAFRANYGEWSLGDGVRYRAWGSATSFMNYDFWFGPWFYLNCSKEVCDLCSSKHSFKFPFLHVHSQSSELAIGGKIDQSVLENTSKLRLMPLIVMRNRG
jgi:hypothetical protein